MQDDNARDYRHSHIAQSEIDALKREVERAESTIESYKKGAENLGRDIEEYENEIASLRAACEYAREVHENVHADTDDLIRAVKRCAEAVQRPNEAQAEEKKR